jgi:hypothetical protein
LVFLANCARGACILHGNRLPTASVIGHRQHYP